MQHLAVLQPLGIEDAVLPAVEGEARGAQVEGAAPSRASWHAMADTRGTLAIDDREGSGHRRVRAADGRRSRPSWSRTAPAPGWTTRSWSGSPARASTRGSRPCGSTSPTWRAAAVRPTPSASSVTTGAPRSRPRATRGRTSRSGRAGSRSAAGSPRWPPPTARSPAAGLVFLGYPLHPPGKPERIRDEHLYRIEVPMLFLQGTTDPFASPELLRRVVEKLGDRADARPVRGRRPLVRGARRKRDPREVGASLAPHAAAFIRERRADAAEEPPEPEYFQPPEAPRPRSRGARVGASCRATTSGTSAARRSTDAPAATTSCGRASGTSWSSRSMRPTSDATGTPSAGGRSCGGSAPIGAPPPE